MPYNPKTWENKPSTASPINATNLNHMEGGIKNNNDDIITVQNAILTLQGEMLQAQGDITALETLVDSIFPVDTESGNPAVITDAFGGSAKSLKLTLEPIQSGSGTPSPQNVRPISGRTQSVVTRTGKNMWNDTDSMLQRMSRNGETYTNTETDTKTAFNARVELILSSSTAYASTVTTISSNGRHSIVVDTTNITYDHFRLKHNGSVRDLIVSLPFSVKGQLTISFDVDGYNPSVVGGLVIKNIQLEIGSTATPYEAYNGEAITRTYGTTIYGGSDDVTGDEMTSSWEIVDLGDLNWTNLYIDRFYSNELTPRKTNSNAICSCFAKNPTEVSTIDGLTSDMTFAFQSTNDFRIIIRDSSYYSADAFKTAMSGMKLAYEVANPTSIPLTAQNITLLHGDNVLTTDADSIEASYSADIALYIDKKIAEGSQGNRSLSKGGSGDEEVKEEVKEEEKKEEIEIKEAEPLTKEVR